MDYKHFTKTLNWKRLLYGMNPCSFLCVLVCSVMSYSLWTIAYQASPYVGFSKQQYWSGLPFPPPGDLPDPDPSPLYCLHCRWTDSTQWAIFSAPYINADLRNLLLHSLWQCMLSCFSCVWLYDPMDCSPPGFSVHGILQARILAAGCHFLLRIFPIQGSNPPLSCLLHWQAGSLPLAPARELYNQRVPTARAFLVAQLVKNPPAMRETEVQSLDGEDPLEKATNFSILAWKIPLMEEPAAAAKLLQLCLTLCDPIDSSPSGSPVPGILMARTLEWVAISFSNAWKWKVKVKPLCRVLAGYNPWGHKESDTTERIHFSHC